jgi:predicted nucleic acid-binding protein
VTGSSNLLFDTNAFIYFFSGGKAIRALVEQTPIIYYSLISEIELLSAPHLTDADMAHIKAFLAMCEPIPLIPEVVAGTVRVRRQYNVRVPDAIIAASALHLNVPLVSADTGFQKIEALSLIADILT